MNEKNLEAISPIDGRYFDKTEKLKKYASKLHELGINQKGLAQELRIGSATVERWYHQCHQKENNSHNYRHCPSVLGIDEHFFSRSKGKRFVTTLCDLRKQRVFDLLPGRSKYEIDADLLSLKGRDRVTKVLSMRGPGENPVENDQGACRITHRVS